MILIWDVEGSEKYSKMLLACLVLVGWNILPVCFVYVNGFVFSGVSLCFVANIKLRQNWVKLSQMYEMYDSHSMFSF